MRGGAAHELDEVPVFLGGVGVAADVADEFAVDAAGGVEAEAGLDPLVLQVAVDGLGAADDLNGNIVGLEVFGQDAGVGVGVVAADDDQRGNAPLLAALAGGLELFGGLQLGPAGTDNVEAAGVPVGVDDVGCEFHGFVLDQSVGSFEEAEEAARLVQGLDAVEETGDDVVSAGGLTAGKDDAHVDGGKLGAGTGGEGEDGAPEGVGEEGLDLIHVAGGGGGFTGGDGNIGALAQSGGEFGGVSGPGLLERRDDVHVAAFLLG